MKNSVSVTDVFRNFSDYLNRVAYRGERFLLVRGGKPVAELAPVPRGARLGELPALLDSLPRLPSGDADAFEEDLVRARHELASRSPSDPWDS